MGSSTFEVALHSRFFRPDNQVRTGGSSLPLPGSDGRSSYVRFLVVARVRESGLRGARDRLTSHFLRGWARRELPEGLLRSTLGSRRIVPSSLSSRSGHCHSQHPGPGEPISLVIPLRLSGRICCGSCRLWMCSPNESRVGAEPENLGANHVP